MYKIQQQGYSDVRENPFHKLIKGTNQETIVQLSEELLLSLGARLILVSKRGGMVMVRGALLVPVHGICVHDGVGGRDGIDVCRLGISLALLAKRSEEGNHCAVIIRQTMDLLDLLSPFSSLQSAAFNTTPAPRYRLPGFVSPRGIKTVGDSAETHLARCPMLAKPEGPVQPCVRPGIEGSHDLDLPQDGLDGLASRFMIQVVSPTIRRLSRYAGPVETVSRPQHRRQRRRGLVKKRPGHKALQRTPQLFPYLGHSSGRHSRYTIDCFPGIVLSLLKLRKYGCNPSPSSRGAHPW